MELNYLPKVYVWIPSWTWFPYPDVLINIYSQTCVKSWEVELYLYNDCIIKRKPIQHARNEIIDNFLKSWCHYLWFVDDDNPPALDVLENLIEHQKDYVSALVPLRHWNKYLLNVFKDWKHLTSYEWLEWPIIEIDNCWTWCVLLSREIAQTMFDKFKGNSYQFKIEEFVCKHTEEVEPYTKQDEYIENWRSIYKEQNWEIVIRSESISEDLFFWREAKKLWFKIYADLRSHCYHYKDITKLKVKYENFINNNTNT